MAVQGACRWVVRVGALVALSALPLGAQSQPPKPLRSTSRATERALLDQYCVTCHNDRMKTANLSLEKLDLATVGDHPELWEKVVRKLRAGVMPPPDVKRPPLAEYEALRDWLETEIDRKAAAHVNPGSVVLHRLNRTEYANVVRDLLDLEIDVTTLLPPDDSARGFDNIAGSLTISPTLLEAYTTAATRVARMAVGYWKTPTESTYLAPGDTSQNQHIEGLPFGTRGGMLVRHNFPADGEYKFSIQNFGIGSYIPGEQLELIIDGERAHLFKYQGVGLSQGMSGEGDGSLDVTIPVKAGSRMVGATFPGDELPAQPRHGQAIRSEVAREQQHPSAAVLPGDRLPADSGTLHRPASDRLAQHPQGLYLPPEPGRGANASQEEPCARDDPLDADAARLSASRHRAGPRGVDDLLRGRPSRRHVSRTASSWRFGDCWRARSSSCAPKRNRPICRAGRAYRISDLELASRLSFFLWSSIPDDELITRGQPGTAEHTPAVLEQQVRRMLADPRSDALVGNFAAQLLYLRNLPATSPDGVFYPDWDDELRQSFRRETELFFESIMREDRNVVDLLTADYTFVNERLARHYGIPNIYGSHFRRVTLGPELDYRRGLAGQGQLSGGHLDAEFQDVTGQARRLGARKHPRHSSAGAAAERSAAGGLGRRAREGADAARADDGAPEESAVRRLPQDHGSDRFRARQLRCRRQVANQAGRRRRHADRCVRRAVRWPAGQRARRAAAGAAAVFASVRPHGDREDDDLRPGPRRRIL